MIANDRLKQLPLRVLRIDAGVDSPLWVGTVVGILCVPEQKRAEMSWEDELGADVEMISVEMRRMARSEQQRAEYKKMRRILQEMYEIQDWAREIIHREATRDPHKTERRKIRNHFRPQLVDKKLCPTPTVASPPTQTSTDSKWRMPVSRTAKEA
jgi:hypothetical protein